MVDPRINDWLSRVPRNGPWLASLALAALIAVELARLAVAWLGGSPLQSVQPTAPAAPAAQRPAIDAQRIAAAHLFGVAAPQVADQDPAHAPPTTASLVLTGTIATNNPKRGIAIISDGGPTKVFLVGDVVGGATVHSVYLEHVILSRDGVLETLSLPHQLPPARAPIARVVRPGINPGTAASVENVRRLVQQDPGMLNQVLRTVASYDNNAGKLRGFRIYPGRNRAAFNSLGLRPGDLVTAINGIALDDPQRGQEVFNTIESSDHATVTIERGGQTQDLTLNINQVATEATRDLTAPTAQQPAGGEAPSPPAPVPAPSPDN